MKTFAKSLIAAVVTGMAFGSVQAAEITTWGFTLDSGFINWAPTPGVTGSNPNSFLSSSNASIPTQSGGSVNFATIGDVPSTLSWGSYPQSSLSVGGGSAGHFTGSLTTNGAAVTTATLTHVNNIITGTSLTSATLFDVLYLDPNGAAPPDAFQVPALSFAIRFAETSNLSSASQCQNTYGVPGGTLCEDIFAIDVAGAGFNPADNSLNQTFVFADFSYNAKIFINGLTQLNAKECQTVYGDTNHANCIGFITNEGVTNNFTVKLQITDKPYNVPEPGTLVLLGGALLGLGGLRRRS